jgi:gas vesicle protein
MEDPMVNERSQVNGTPPGAGSSVALGLVLGALVGAGIALLLAPATGKETRRRLTDAGRRWSGAARNTLDQARDAANNLKQDAKSALEAGRESFEDSQRSREPRPAAPSELKG